MWRIKIHQLVVKEDFKSIEPTDKFHILKAIHKKLSLDPQAYGKPLRGEFQGYWRLRVQDYRVIYRMIREEVVVVVVKVGIRKDEQVYRELINRLRTLKRSS